MSYLRYTSIERFKDLSHFPWDLESAAFMH